MEFFIVQNGDTKGVLGEKSGGKKKFFRKPPSGQTKGASGIFQRVDKARLNQSTKFGVAGARHSKWCNQKVPHQTMGGSFGEKPRWWINCGAGRGQREKNFPSPWPQPFRRGGPRPKVGVCLPSALDKPQNPKRPRARPPLKRGRDVGKILGTWGEALDNRAYGDRPYSIPAPIFLTRVPIFILPLKWFGGKRREPRHPPPGGLENFFPSTPQKKFKFFLGYFLKPQNLEDKKRAPSQGGFLGFKKSSGEQLFLLNLRIGPFWTKSPSGGFRLFKKQKVCWRGFDSGARKLPAGPYLFKGE